MTVDAGAAENQRVAAEINRGAGSFHPIAIGGGHPVGTAGGTTETGPCEGAGERHGAAQCDKFSVADPCVFLIVEGELERSNLSGQETRDVIGQAAVRGIHRRGGMIHDLSERNEGRRRGHRRV